MNLFIVHFKVCSGYRCVLQFLLQLVSLSVSFIDVDIFIRQHGNDGQVNIIQGQLINCNCHLVVLSLQLNTQSVLIHVQLLLNLYPIL